MPKQKGKIVPLGINYSEVLKQELDATKKKRKSDTSREKKKKKPATEDAFKGMMSLF